MCARLFTAFAGATLLLATPALAEQETKSATVKTADLNLGTAEGRAELDGRIRKAADQVCGKDIVGTDALVAFQTCRYHAWTSANRDAARLVERKSGRVQVALNAR